MFRFVIGIIFGILSIVLFIQNTEIVSVNFLFWTFSLSRFFLLFSMFVAGLFFGWLTCGIGRLKSRRKNKT